MAENESRAGEDLFSDSDDFAYLSSGTDWDQIVAEQAERSDEIIVINMGPQHPSTHGVMRLMLELDGETVLSLRPGIGFLHTGIEKNMEFRSWTQGAAFMTRANYVSGIHNEAVYALAVEKLLGVSDQIPVRANQLRVMMLEVNRIASHLTAVGSGALELGASSVAEVGLREREICLEFSEAVTGLRMNNAYIRPGGVSVDLPSDGLDRLRELIDRFDKYLPEIGLMTLENPIFKARLCGVGCLDLSAAMALGVTGPALRSTGYPWDLRKMQPYCGYENYEFDVCVAETMDAYGRYLIRLNEMEQSVRILRQLHDCLQETIGQPHTIADARLGSPSDLTVGSDGQGNSNEHIKHIMGSSMEGLIHHFKMVTEGFQVPAGQVYVAIEGPSGELGCHLVSDGTNRPYRAHLRDPGFTNIQALPIMCEGNMLSDVVMSLASIDPVMGGVDR